MVYRKFGKTNEMVSVLGFGCMRLPLLPGGDPGKIDEALSTKLLHYAIDQGVNYVDTAYPYHSGQSEPILGKALQNGYRQKVKLATKLPSWLIHSEKDMDQYLNEQLKRLRTDYIDFYLIHSLHSYSWKQVRDAGVCDFLDRAIRQGKIRYAGFSFHDELPLFKEIVDAYDWSLCQIQYNYLDENFQAGTEGLLYAAEKGLGVTVMEPMRGGKLAQNLPKEAVEAFEQSAPGRTPAGWALRWVLVHPEVSVVLSGMNSMEQLEDNLKTAEGALPGSFTQTETDTVEQIKEILQNRIKIDCTGCGYCLPCPSGVNIPVCFNMYNNYHMFQKKDSYTIWLDPPERAGNCVACGRCVKLCPQGIAIPDELEKVKELYE